MALRRGDEPDPLDGMGAVVAALRGLTTVAAEGAAKASAEESSSRPPMEIKARVTDDGRTLFDLKNVTTDGDPQALAQAAYDEPNERFAQKFMNIRRDRSVDNIGSVIRSLRDRPPPTAPPTADGAQADPLAEALSKVASAPASLRAAGNAAADDVGLPRPDRDEIAQDLESFSGQYRLQRDIGADPFTAVLQAAFVKALPKTMESSIRQRQANAQLLRRAEDLGRVYGILAPIKRMYEDDADGFMKFVQGAKAVEERDRNEVMKAVKVVSDSGVPNDMDPDAYVAQLAGLGVLPEPFKPLVRQTIAERERKMTNAAEAEGRAEKRDVRADASAERAEKSAERAVNAETRAQERFNVAMEKVGEATAEKPYKFAVGDYKTLDADALAEQYGSDKADQPSLERTVKKRLKWQSAEFDTLTAERKGLQSEIADIVTRRARQKAIVAGPAYSPGAEAQLARLESREAAIRNRMVQIDALREPLVAEIGKLQSIGAKGGSSQAKAETFTPRIEEGIKAHMAKNRVDRATAIKQLRDAKLLP